MTKRERILAAAVGAIVLLYVAGWAWTKYSTSVANKEMQQLAAEQRLGAAKNELARGEAALHDLSEWQSRSLPADRATAQMQYRIWLEQQLKAAGLVVEEIQPQQRLAPAAGYSAIGYSINVHGNLQALTKFLHAYYGSDLLQQIVRMQLRPDNNPTQLKISLQTEALIVAGTPNEELPRGTTAREAQPSVTEYAQSIGSRNVFTVYRPPRPEPPPRVARETPPPPKFDDAKFAYFTGTIQVDGRYQAWIHVRTTNETLRLFEGDEVKVGLFDGKVLSIEPRAIVVENGDEQLRVDLGENLRDGEKPST